ncbi:histidinol-phosphatase HisJ family protein [Acutalibacter sp. 1XD8-33]|uniref:histidinol-phosphatase HisJ family protein n=1 Tax=Acutalibacter sp. 1XD8-33 TaxID=2320081 RepID=UPI000EA0165C|nr:histidinol-phosphatase HisJ family protein [Acutalibacter sp. 1XD8-33]RKJ41371.1 histidinol-phosphatase HisJ family protein [Acutalibacter sp. 1XD8-33]
MLHSFASDCHNHSACSPDGRHTPAAMLARARELGLYAYTLTDHCECQEYWEKYRERAQTAFGAMEALAPEEIRFCRGLELGQPLQDLSGAEDAVKRFPYDFVIGSLHNLENREDFYFLDCTRMPLEEIHGLLREYWRELLEMISWGGFDSLGHLTYPLRYIQGEQGISIDLHPHKEAIDQVFLALIQKEIALEVNTSGLRQKLGRTMPDLPLLARYRELGGRLATLGSDAHCTEDLGGGIDEGMGLLKEAGFTEFAIYEKRRPVMLPLE